MGILEHKTKGTEAEQKIAEALSKPWYRKVESWLTIVNIIAIAINIFIVVKIL